MFQYQEREGTDTVGGLEVRAPDDDNVVRLITLT